jgi:hypothetical protein
MGASVQGSMASVTLLSSDATTGTRLASPSPAAAPFRGRVEVVRGAD